MDAQSNTQHPIHRQDYRAPDWLVPDVELEFDLDPLRTLVTARLSVVRNGDHDRPLRLDGDGLRLLKLAVDGRELEPRDWRIETGQLVLGLDQATAMIETLVEISPEANTQLMGLYASRGLLCTQCEAEGFRRITWFPDRPDVLSRYKVRLSADRMRFPVLLANGNPVSKGDGPGASHWSEWEDPFPKPCYLFALVAGDLFALRDTFTTFSGRSVDLAIWVREADLPKTHHAMAALKAAMAWDERVYGREYDLNQFNIVAVSDFNFGAMENKGLNIFNARYILADADTATDGDFDAVAAVVAHEYFHNWSGNRVTCRDWFQLSLKEGFTVFRDQSFSADEGSPAVKRIEDVRSLRTAQFPEDAGPLAHPVRPESYVEITNFYTATVYNKGAELIRMMATLLGPEAFRKGADLYFDRHDGKAVTCEDFVRAMEDASGIDLGQFRLWYSQAGTPRVTADLTYDEAGKFAELTLQQTIPPTAGQLHKQPTHIPLKLALFGHESGERLGDEQLVELRSAAQQVRFDDIAEKPVLSINRNFSAPVIIESRRSAEDLAFLSGHDDDPFARYEALQQLMLDTLIAGVKGEAVLFNEVVDAVGSTLDDKSLDSAFIAEAVLLPSEALVGDRMDSVDPEAIHRVREALRGALGQQLLDKWQSHYAASTANRYELSPAAKGARRLRSVVLGYIATSSDAEAAALAFRQFEAADNMTDRQGALTVLANGDSPERVTALREFRARYAHDPLVIDKWFSTQALSIRADTLESVIKLSAHPDFTIANPNRLRSLIGSLAANQRAFHSGDGAGYRFLAGMILAIDRLNPQSAARLVTPLGRWRRFDEHRGRLMHKELERIAATPHLSKDVLEQVSKSLS